MQIRNLNTEAGYHAITSDPQEIAAVTRAAERSFAEFPYYEARYGERGFRFGRSDGAWLVVTCDSPQAIEQVHWLGGVLSSRGMPQILLERHLEIMHEELPSHRGLLQCARDLHALRTGAIPVKRFDRLAAEFDSTAGGALQNFGRILLSAVADERLGIEHAVTSVGAWAADPKRFPKRWVQAVKKTIDRARER